MMHGQQNIEFEEKMYMYMSLESGLSDSRRTFEHSVFTTYTHSVGKHSTEQHHKTGTQITQFTLLEAPHSSLSFHVTHKDKDAP
jgi:hypothetical protein